MIYLISQVFFAWTFFLIFWPTLWYTISNPLESWNETEKFTLTSQFSHHSDFELEYINEVFSWDDKVAGAKVLLAEATGSSQYVNAMNDVCEAYKSTPKSPGGRSHFMQWGSNRYASNAAFICLRVRRTAFALCTIFMILLTLWNSKQKNGLLIKLFLFFIWFWWNLAKL